MPSFLSQETSKSTPCRRRNTLVVAGAAAIVVLTLIAYVPAMRGGYVWDDDVYVTENPLLTAPDGLKRIWFSLDSPSQYFPLVYTTFRIEHALWGLDPAGYHIVNVILHILNSLLVWLLLSKLRIGGAWLAAAIWALHPVNVESVAWITERKNTLSTLFYLLTVLAWLRFADSSGRRAYWYYVLALVLCQLALFAKTTACTLPAALLIALWLKGDKAGVPLGKGDRPPGRGGPSAINHQPSAIPAQTSAGLTGPSSMKRGVQVLPFLALGIGMGVISVWWERYHQGTIGAEFAFSPVQRLLIASRALWFYLSKLAWPAELTFSYPKWSINAAEPRQYAWLIACLAAAALIWWRRRDLGRGPIAALVFFAAALSPMLGFIPLYTFRYSFVADHYQYAASIGPIALFAAALSRQWSSVYLRSVMHRALPAAVLIALGILTWRQGHVYRNSEALWRDNLAKNPSSWMAYNNLGAVLLEKGSPEEALEYYAKALKVYQSSEGHIGTGAALTQMGRPGESIPHYRRALDLRPNDPDAYYNMGIAFADMGSVEKAIESYSKALELNPHHLRARNNLGSVLASRGDFEAAAAQYMGILADNPEDDRAHVNLANILAETGHPDEAARHYLSALAVNPANETVHYNLARLLSTQGKLAEAILHYREAIRLNPANANAHYNLAGVLGAQNRHEEAIREYREAIRIKPDFADAHNNLAVALYFAGEYARAWDEVAAARRYGIEPHPEFLRALSQAMPAPR